MYSPPESAPFAMRKIFYGAGAARWPCLSRFGLRTKETGTWKIELVFALYGHKETGVVEFGECWGVFFFFCLKGKIWTGRWDDERKIKELFLSFGLWERIGGMG